MKWNLQSAACYLLLSLVCFELFSALAEMLPIVGVSAPSVTNAELVQKITTVLVVALKKL